MGNRKRYGTQPDSICVIKVLLNSIPSPPPLLPRFLIQCSTLLPDGESTYINRTQCQTPLAYQRKPETSRRKENRRKRVRHSRRRKAATEERRRMKAVKDDKEKAIDDGDEDREERSLMESGTNLRPVTRITMATRRTLS
ncbi:hypothetical protein IGI04_034926 [Brassica rapa subsp. trilocularis]|uniref:IBB domain-containing protein n=1 Tax=Brassica rapa subsp. trilocularis TaxID=1813537 RepID=A0ABQ7LCG6_BRACM|nr:hypothetical protein IGI04_034926 [Brassica rapa subsp. trilocularis]